MRQSSRKSVGAVWVIICETGRFRMETTAVSGTGGDRRSDVYRIHGGALARVEWLQNFPTIYSEAVVLTNAHTFLPVISVCEGDGPGWIVTSASPASLIHAVISSSPCSREDDDRRKRRAKPSPMQSRA